MKKLLALASVSLILVGLGADRAHAFGCDGCCSKCPAAQYNAFSPFCCSAVCFKKGLCKKCCYVADCCQPCCPQPCCPPPCCEMDCGGCYDGGIGPAPVMAPPAGGNPAPQGFTPPAPAPMPMGNSGMMGVPYAMPYSMPRPMVQPVGYYPAYYHNYVYPQSPAMTPGYAAMMSNGMVPMNSVPWYWNPGR